MDQKRCQLCPEVVFLLFSSSWWHSIRWDKHMCRKSKPPPLWCTGVKLQYVSITSIMSFKKIIIENPEHPTPPYDSRFKYVYFAHCTEATVGRVLAGSRMTHPFPKLGPTDCISCPIKTGHLIKCCLVRYL